MRRYIVHSRWIVDTALFFSPLGSARRILTTTGRRIMMLAEGAESMEQLSYGALRRAGYDGYVLEDVPVKAL